MVLLAKENGNRNAEIFLNRMESDPDDIDGVKELKKIFQTKIIKNLTRILWKLKMKTFYFMELFLI